jgi:hypothetical protein
MKKALISPDESVIHYNGTTVLGQRVAEVHDTGFEVASPLHWVDCADDLVAQNHYYDAGDSTIKPVPVKSAEELAAEAATFEAGNLARKLAAARKLVSDYEAAKALLDANP